MANQVRQFATGMVARTVLVALGTLVGTIAASAQTGSDFEPSPAYKEALQAYDQAWDASGLAFAVATFTEAPSSGFGDYAPRRASSFSANDTLSVYAEPVGYTFSESESGYGYKLTASYKLLNTSGQVLAEQENFAEFTGTGRSKQRELSAALNFQFSGLPAGDYTLETRFTDEVGGNESGFTLPFTVNAAN